MLAVPVTVADINDWVRKCATTVNQLIGRTANLAAFRDSFASLPDFVNDATAAAGGVPVGGLYRSGSAVMVRVV